MTNRHRILIAAAGVWFAIACGLLGWYLGKDRGAWEARQQPIDPLTTHVAIAAGYDEAHDVFNRIRVDELGRVVCSPLRSRRPLEIRGTLP